MSSLDGYPTRFSDMEKKVSSANNQPPQWVAWCFASTILIGAFLVFQVQPVISKTILPWFGGTPAVWTTCMLFPVVLHSSVDSILVRAHVPGEITVSFVCTFQRRFFSSITELPIGLWACNACAITVEFLDAWILCIRYLLWRSGALFSTTKGNRQWNDERNDERNGCSVFGTRFRAICCLVVVSCFRIGHATCLDESDLSGRRCCSILVGRATKPVLDNFYHLFRQSPVVLTSLVFVGRFCVGTVDCS